MAKVGRMERKEIEDIEKFEKNAIEIVRILRILGVRNEVIKDFVRAAERLVRLEEQKRSFEQIPSKQKYIKNIEKTIICRAMEIEIFLENIESQAKRRLEPAERGVIELKDLIKREKIDEALESKTLDIWR